MTERQKKEIISLSKAYLERIREQFLTAPGDVQTNYALYDREVSRELQFLRDFGINL